jgi:hypothetical protein
MSFLTINGLTVSIQGEPVINPDIKENRRTTYNGDTRIIRKYNKDSWELETTMMTADKADNLRGLMDGEGHYFSFDSDLYSFKGLSPESGYSVTLLGSGGKYSGGLQVDTDIDYDFSYSNEYTVVFWRATASGNTFNHYAFNSDNTKYYNGSENAGVSITFANMDSDGLLTLDNDSDGNADVFDDLIVVPFIMTENMISAIYNLGEAYSNLPRLKINGDMLGNNQTICEGIVNNQPYQPFRSGGSFNNNGQRVSFTLFEV